MDVPLLAAFIGYALYAETPNMFQIIGGGLIVSGGIALLINDRYRKIAPLTPKIR